MNDYAKPPLEIVYAWITFRSRIMRAQVIEAKSKYLFNCDYPDLRHKAAKMHRHARELERMALAIMYAALKVQYKARWHVDRRKGDDEWIVTTWQPYRQGEAVSYRLFKSMRLPVRGSGRPPRAGCRWR